jgi:hypothetical protein
MENGVHENHCPAQDWILQPLAWTLSSRSDSEFAPSLWEGAYYL